MGYLITRSSKASPRENRSGGNARLRLAQEPVGYSRSALALDMQHDGSLAWQPMPQLVRPAAAPAAAANGILGRGGDLFGPQKDRASSAISFVVHVVIISAILWWGFAAKGVIHSESTVVPITLTDPPPPLMPVAKETTGGGGGGAHQAIVPVKAPPPHPVPHIHLLAPQIERVAQPKLASEPDSQVNMQANSTMPTMGMPDSPQIALASQGSGAHGLGSGMGGGIGMGHGTGTGVGGGGGFGGGIMTVGGGVSAPIVIHKVDAEFTEQARKADYQGTVSLQLIVDQRGDPQDVRVVRHAGMGLDEKAVEAVEQYKFRPSMYEGHPVAVQLVIDVDFRLH